MRIIFYIHTDRSIVKNVTNGDETITRMYTILIYCSYIRYPFCLHPIKIAHSLFRSLSLSCSFSVHNFIYLFRAFLFVEICKVCVCAVWIRVSNNNKSLGYHFGVRFALKYPPNIKRPWSNRIGWYNSWNANINANECSRKIIERSRISEKEWTTTKKKIVKC